MADSFTQVPPDSTGDKIDTEQLTVGANTVERQRIQIAGTGATDIAAVSSTAGLKVDLGADNDVTITGSLPAGTNNIGDVDIASALPAGTNNIGDIDVLTMPGTAAEATALPTQFVVIALDDGTDTVPAQGSATGDLKVTLDGENVTIGSALPAGTNNIGDVDIASALPAGTNNIGDVDVLSVADSSGANLVGSVAISATHVYDDLAGGQALAEVKFASVDVAASGNTQIVAAVTGKNIRVLNYVLVASGGANTVTWRSATAGPVTGGMGLAANGGVSAESQFGLFQTTAGEALQINLSAATSVDGHITYIEVD